MGTPSLAACNPSCTACPLHTQCKTTCIPAVWYSRERDWPQSADTIWTGLHIEHDRALYVIGEAPGYNEDQQGKPWVGQAGKILKTLYLDYFKFLDQADVFLSNAVRCRPPGNKSPTKTQLKMCQGFYLADIIYLQKLYDQVIVLCCGAPATQSVLGLSLKKSFTRQGGFTDFRALTATTPKSIIRLGEVVGPYLNDPTLPPFPRPCPVFTTYHPMAVGHDKNKGLSVKPHLDMLVDYLKGDLTYEIKGGSLDIQMAPAPPDYPLSRLSLDIETYGILKGFKPHPSQRKQFFHPLKSELYDGIPKEKLVVTTGLTWINDKGKMEHGIFIMSRERDRRRLWSWIKTCRKQYDATSEMSSTKRLDTSQITFGGLLGQNLKFDLMYLRHAYPECKTWLNYPLPIVDLAVTNYLLNEGRPERSLKALAPLLRVTQYGSFTQHSCENSTTLHQYNCQDTAATLLSQTKLEKLIRDLYGESSPKISTFNREWYSKLLWLTVWMEEAGVAMDERALRGLLKSYEARMVKLERGIKNRWNINLRGKGSEKHKREIMNRACSTLLEAALPVPSLEKTKERHDISFKEENRNALLDVLPKRSQAAVQLRSIARVHDVGGNLDRYLYPLLVGRGSGHADPTTRLIDGKAYARIYPVPSEYDDGVSGGTKQCRIVFKGPAIQTFPPPIKACITSRYGYLIWFDYSQIELRIAALLSGDSWMMEEFNKPDCDFHLETARKLFGDENAKKLRQVAKTLNFLVIYLGGAGQFQTTLLRDEGIVQNYTQCEQHIKNWWKQATGLAKWQEETYEFVCKHGYFQLPLAGQSRLFLGNRAEVRNQMKEIVNMPVQAVAANVMLSAQFELQWAFMQKRMKAILPVNVYDAATIEFPKPELYAVKQEMERILPDPPYYQALCKILGRRLPLKCKVEITEIAA